MTYQEARAFFKLKDTDPIHEAGVLSVKASAEKQINVWSLTNRMREELAKEIEACDALLAAKEEWS